MTLQDELLTIEKKLWTGGAESYQRNLDDDCLVAFTQMAGVSSRDEVAATAEGDRWRDLDLAVEGVLRPTPDVALLTYRASAVLRADEEAYRALVSSGYVKRDGGWKMMFHQQTPLGT